MIIIIVLFYPRYYTTSYTFARFRLIARKEFIMEQNRLGINTGRANFFFFFFFYHLFYDITRDIPSHIRVSDRQSTLPRIILTSCARVFDGKSNVDENVSQQPPHDVTLRSVTMSPTGKTSVNGYI